MIAPLLWCLLAAPGLPGVVVIATAPPPTSGPMATDRCGAAVAVPLLAQPLGLTVAIEGSRVAVTVGGAAFVFQLGAPFVRAGGTVYGLVGEPYTARDTVFLPLSWLADCVPRALGPRYRWHAGAARLEELPVAGPVAASPPPVAPTAATTPNPISGLRFRHTVVIDPGHGGDDHGVAEAEAAPWSSTPATAAPTPATPGATFRTGSWRRTSHWRSRGCCAPSSCDGASRRHLPARPTR